MTRDSLVTAGDVLAATREVRRVGNTAALTDLEQREPELAGLLLDEASDFHRRLGLLHVPYDAQRRLTRRVERLGLHLVLALSAAHRRLWNDLAAGTPPADRSPQLPPTPEA